MLVYYMRLRFGVNTLVNGRGYNVTPHLVMRVRWFWAGGDIATLPRYVSGGIVVVAALAAGALLKAVVPNFLSSSNSTILQEGFAEAELQVRSSLPRRVDEVTTLVAVSHSGTMMVYVFQLDIDTVTQEELVAGKNRIAAKGCASENFRYNLRLGATMRYTYQNPSGNLLGSFDIVEADCG